MTSTEIALKNYNSYISSIENCRQLIKTYNDCLKETKKELEEKKKELVELEKEIEKERKKKLEDYRLSLEEKETKETREKLAEQIIEYEELKKEKEDKIDSLSPETISEEYTKKYLGIDKLGTVLENVKARFKKIYGEEVYNVLSQNILAEKITDTDLKSLIKFIREYNGMYNNLNVTENAVVVELEQSLYETLKYLPGDDKLYFILFSMILFISFLFFDFIWTFGLLAIVISNITVYYSTYIKFEKFTKMYVNYDTIKSIIINNARELYELEVNGINERYEDQLSAYENAIEEYKSEIENIKNDLEVDEAIPNGIVDQMYRVQLESTKNEIKSIEEDLVDTEKNIEEQRESLDNILAELDSQKEKLQSAFIKKEFGKEVLPITKFLIGYEDDNITPVIFEFNKKSTLLMYDGSDKSYRSLVELFKMIVIQQMFNMRAGCVFFNIVDDVYMCKDFQIYTDKIADIVNLCTMSSDISSFLSKSIEELKISQHAVRESADIDKFNEFMLSIDSSTHYYIFNLFLNYQKDIFKTEQFIKLMTVGNSAGIYNIIALSQKDDIVEYKEILNYVQDTIVLETLI